MPPDPWTLYEGDARAVLPALDAESVHCCVTSHPYYGLRDYGTATWEGGDPACDHRKLNRRQNLDKLGERLGTGGGVEASSNSVEPYVGGFCGRCGAKRIDRQIGLEATPDEFAVCRECGRCAGCGCVCGPEPDEG